MFLSPGPKILSFPGPGRLQIQEYVDLQISTGQTNPNIYNDILKT